MQTEPSLTERAYIALEEKICTLELAPGAFLSEGALSRELNIGRTPVREALQRLAREGLISIMPRRGIQVSNFDVAAQLRMLEVRREIERLIARTAALRSTSSQRQFFDQLGKSMLAAAAAGDALRFMRLDLDFNRQIATSAHNEYAVAAISLMAGLSRRFWFMHNQRSDDLAETATRHARIAATIAAGDADSAAIASDDLMDYIEQITRAADHW